MKAELVKNSPSSVPLSSVPAGKLAVIMQTDGDYTWQVGHVLLVGWKEIWSLSDRTHLTKEPTTVKVRVLEPGEEVRLIA